MKDLIFETEPVNKTADRFELGSRLLSYNELPLVSIIIDNYNYGQYLEAAIESALVQTYHNIEVVVVDDGSTDNSREIISRYDGQIIAVLKENGGQASALNAGFLRSQGEVIIFLDSDDILLPDTVGRVIKIFQAQPDVAKVMYRTEIIDATGMRTGIINPPSYLPMRSGDLRRYVLAFPFDMTWMATSGNAFSMRILQEIFPIPERDFDILADLYLSHLTPLFGLVVSLDDVGAYYRVHGSNNYQLSTPTINLRQIRQSIQYCQNTIVYIKRFANLLHLSGYSNDACDPISVSYVANRMISLKLDPSHHPMREDTVLRLFLQGICAILQRFDISLWLKLLFLLWFGAFVIAPRPLARWLATKFLFPETRSSFNTLLKGFHQV